jgi:uncharacterized protein
MMAFKSAKFEIKSIDDAGTFTGLASVFGNVDLGGDVIEHGAFVKTISDKPQVPILLGHDPNQIIGIGNLKETTQGLEIAGKLVLDSNPPAQRAYSLMKAGALKGLSIGFDVVRHAMQGSVRQLKELKLYEVSLTPFPMNEAAQVVTVKAVDHSGELRAIGELRQMIRKAMR